ncbi:MAG TPA: hypothetical protein VFZ58_01685 [Candidatus Saccharimonadales bacterium]
MALLWKVPATLGILAVGVVMMLLIWSATFDRLLGMIWYSTQVEVDILENASSDEVLLVGVGFQNSARKVGATLGPEVQAVMNVALIQFAQRGFNFDGIYNTVMAKIKQQGFKRISLYGGSMGAQFQARFMAKYHAEGMPLGKIRVVIFDDPVTSWRSTTYPKWVMQFFGNLPAGPTLTLIKGPFIYNMVRKAIAAAEEGVDRNALKSHYWAMGLWPMPSTAAELTFMVETDVSTMNLRGIAERLVVVSGDDGDGDDPLIKLNVSMDELEQALGAKPALKIDPARQKGEHNTAAERPKFIAIVLREQLELAS